MKLDQYPRLVGILMALLVVGGCADAAQRTSAPAVLPVLPRHPLHLATGLPTGLVDVNVEQRGPVGSFSGSGTIDLDTCEGRFSGGGLEWQRRLGGSEMVRSDGDWYDLADDRAPTDGLTSLFHVITRTGDLEQRGPLCSLNILPALIYGPGTPVRDGEVHYAEQELVEGVLLAGIGRKIVNTTAGTAAELEVLVRQHADEVLIGLGDLSQRSIMVKRLPGDSYRITEEWSGAKVVFDVSPAKRAPETTAAVVAPRGTAGRVAMSPVPGQGASSSPRPREGSALIGDSLTDKSLPFMDPELVAGRSGVAPVYARPGFSVYELLEYDLIPLESLPSTVVLALGTVDMRMQTPVRQREYAIELLNRLGPERRILWIDTFSAKGTHLENLPVPHAIPDLPHLLYNELLADLAERYPNVEIVSWSRYAGERGISPDDGIHYHEDGYRSRAGFLEKVLRGN